MSQKRKYTIQCPSCRREQDVELYESVNIGLAPELRDELLRNRLNAVTCTGCSHVFRIDKPLLYHDPSHNIMIYLIPLRGGSIEAGEREFTDCITRLNEVLPEGIPTPEVHLVFSQVELVERIFMLETKLNERVVEYIKHLIYTKNRGKIEPRDKIILFDAEDSTPEQLSFVVQDAASRKLEAMLQFPRETYKALSEMFDSDEQTPNLFELFPGPYISARAIFLRDGEVKEPE